MVGCNSAATKEGLQASHINSRKLLISNSATKGSGTSTCRPWHAPQPRDRCSFFSLTSSRIIRVTHYLMYRAAAVCIDLDVGHTTCDVESTSFTFYFVTTLRDHCQSSTLIKPHEQLPRKQHSFAFQLHSSQNTPLHA